MQIKYNKRYFKSEENATLLTNNDVERHINEVLNNLLESSETKDYYFRAICGAAIIGFKCCDEIDIVVCKGYEEANLFKNQKGDWNIQDHIVYEKYGNLDCDDLLDIIATLEQKAEYLQNNNDNRPAKEYFNIKPEYNPRKEI